MDASLVAACGVVGAAVGAVLDPLGQRLADRSRAAEDRARAERAERAERDLRGAEQPAPRTGVTPTSLDVPDGVVPPLTVPELGADAPGSPAPDDPVPAQHLLPSGRSTGRTAAVAIATGALWAAVADHFGTHLVVTPFLVFVAMAVVVAVTDLSHRLVPRQLVYGALVLIAPLLVGVSAADHAWHHLVTAAISGAVAFALFFCIWFFVPKGMGFGDVRLAGVIGLTIGYLGPVHVYLGFLMGFVLGLLFGLVLMAGSSTGRRTRIPFAPPLATGATLAIFWGGSLGQHLFHSGS